MASTVTLTIKNNSGKDLVVAFVQGGIPGQTVDQLKWLSFVPATIIPKATHWETPNNPQRNADLNPYMLDIPAGQETIIAVPAYSELVGFRGLVSEMAYKNDALQVLNGKNYMAFPNLMSATYVFDKFEAGLTEGTPGIWNITSVDFLGIPMQLTKGDVTVGYREGVTASGMNTVLSNMKAPYSDGKSVSPNTHSTIYRFFSPQHIASANKCLDTAITTDLPKLAQSKVVVKYGVDEFSDFKNNTVSGSPVIGSLTCTSKLYGSITVNNISTVNAFAGEIGISDGTTKVFGALIAAALCRGVLGNPEKWGDIKYPNSQCSTPWNYYPARVESDEYSKVIHEYSIDGKNYGFSYDDYFGDEAGYNVVPGESVTLNVMAITGDMTILPNPTPPVKTGCLSVGIPDPAAQAKRMGAMSCNGVRIDSLSNVMCFLEDKLIIKFTNAPAKYKNPEIHIDLTKTTQSDAISYYDKNGKSTTLSVVGLVYLPQERQLSFGTTSVWTN